MILRATELLQPGRSRNSATQLALGLNAGYNLAATLASIPAGHVGDRRGMLRVLAGGAACFLLAFVGFAATGESIVLLALFFTLAGVGIGCAETAESAAVQRARTTINRGNRVRVMAMSPATGTKGERKTRWA